MAEKFVLRDIILKRPDGSIQTVHALMDETNANSLRDDWVAYVNDEDGAPQGGAYVYRPVVKDAPESALLLRFDDVLAVTGPG